MQSSKKILAEGEERKGATNTQTPNLLLRSKPRGIEKHFTVNGQYRNE